MIIQNLMTSTKVTLIIPILTYDILMQDENEALCMGTLLEPRMLSCNYVTGDFFGQNNILIVMLRYSSSSSFISSLQPIKSGSHLKPIILATTPQNLQYFEMRVETESLLFNKVFWVVYSLLFLLIFTHSPISSVSAFPDSQLTISLKN